MRKKKNRALTEEDWAAVYKIRCRSKLGTQPGAGEMALLYDAYKADSERYAAMNDAIFRETAPFGATVKP